MQPLLGSLRLRPVAEVGDCIRVHHRIGFDAKARRHVRLVLLQHPGHETTVCIAVGQYPGDVAAERDPRMRADHQRTQRGAVEVLGQVAVIAPEAGMFHGGGDVVPRCGTQRLRLRLV